MRSEDEVAHQFVFGPRSNQRKLNRLLPGDGFAKRTALGVFNGLQDGSTCGARARRGPLRKRSRALKRCATTQGLGPSLWHDRAIGYPHIDQFVSA